MFDIRRQVRLQQAKHALRDGRLDEAFAIATEKEIRDLCGGQGLLEELVDPLLERAAQHLAAGHLKDAFLDVERAIQAGGNRPNALQLRQQVKDAMEAQERAARRAREIVESARRHLQEGSLHTGQELLKDVPADSPEASRLLREAESRERKAEKALARAAEHLAREELMEAMAHAEEALQVSARHDGLPDLIYQLKKAVAGKIQSCVEEGNLRVAVELCSKLQNIAGESLESRELETIIALVRDASRAFQEGGYGEARIALGRLKKMVPKATWIDETLEELIKIDDGMKVLWMGPLALETPAKVPQDDFRARTITMSPPGHAQNPKPHQEEPSGPLSHRLLLWVDGIGTYLILTSDKVSIGRAGSSAHPDIALAADIAGYHAEILRVEDDYFLVAGQQPVLVDGRPTQRKLLSNGDAVDLGPRCRLTFHQPTAMSATALLSLHKGQRIEGDVRQIVLLKEHLILGGKGHIETNRNGSAIVISARSQGLVCRAKEDITVNGVSAGLEASIPLGAQIQVGDVTFTITDCKVGRA